MSDSSFASVYGPVHSWRYGRSLGVDLIGATSTCSFNCVYCQLGEIERITSDRAVYVPTERLVQDLQAFAPWADIDVVTISGSGEPTLALNLEEAIAQIQQHTGKPVTVLTNSTLLGNAEVRSALARADRVAAKLDAVTPKQWAGVNRPATDISWEHTWAGLLQFRQEYQGHLSVQTMLMSPWSATQRQTYIQRLQTLQPAEVQLNLPSRPKPLQRQLEGRGNHADAASRAYPVQVFKQVSGEVLAEFAREIQEATGIPVVVPRR